MSETLIPENPNTSHPQMRDLLVISCINSILFIILVTDLSISVSFFDPLKAFSDFDWFKLVSSPDDALIRLSMASFMVSRKLKLSELLIDLLWSNPFRLEKDSMFSLKLLFLLVDSRMVLGLGLVLDGTGLLGVVCISVLRTRRVSGSFEILKDDVHNTFVWLQRVDFS